MLGSASFSRDCNNPEADAAGGMVLEVSISPGGAFMNGVAVITAAARGVLVAGRCPQWVDYRTVLVRVKPVLAPLPYIAQHVIKTESIRFFLAHRVGRLRPLLSLYQAVSSSGP